MSYTQSPPLTPEEIDIFLKETEVARICTINKDGTIHAVPVWFKYEKGIFLIAAPEKSLKIKNILSNRNITLIIDIYGATWKGVIVYGKADVDYNEWDKEGISLCEKYLKDVSKASQWWIGINNITKWVKITVTPDHMVSFDGEKDTAFSDAVTG